jgi:hypothetical protein
LINLRCLLHSTPHSSLLLVQNSHSTCMACTAADNQSSALTAGRQKLGRAQLQAVCCHLLPP